MNTDDTHYSHEIEKILQENRQLKNDKMCKICMDADYDTVLLPCGHLCTCYKCARPLERCPICRKLILTKVKTC